ncbi:ABC transporter ATP-binding protein [Marinicrinis lubricantis]|uniref:ABC transporter ATP-binding protein n=1 Tax=Marinicrinis lubricantis TaxID=2086470 RepID=A0ABW1IML9_9BACL
MNTMIELKQIYKAFDAQTVIPTMSLSVLEGEFLTLLGPSGCGKTTLLRMIAGFEHPTEGAIYLAGKEITGHAPYKRDMNLVFQHYALFPHMNVEDNILFGLKMKKIAAAEQKRRLQEVLEQTQLTSLRKRKPDQLSGGQQQRVAIARAIINHPKVLLLDEPLGALDYQLRKSLQLELKNLQKRLGITFIYVTHDQEEAMTMSDRIAVMNQGVIEQLASPEEIYRRPANRFVAQFVGENNIFARGDEWYCVRPHHIKAVDTGTSSEGSSISGTVEDAVFTGSMTKLFVRSDQGERWTLYEESYQSRVKGQSVKLIWSKENEVGLGC